MSEQQLNGSDVSTGLEQVDGEGVTERVHVTGLLRPEI
jgi:hypothetical protein